MKSLKIIVKGRVQRAGYRNFVDEAAYSLGIKGQVRNLEDGSVEILAQHESGDVLGEFVKKISVSTYPIHVRSVSKEGVDIGPFDEFDIMRGDLSTEQSERLDEAAFYLRGLSGKIDSFSENTSSRFDVVDTKYGKISDRLEKISDSLDELVSVLRQFVPHK